MNDPRIVNIIDILQRGDVLTKGDANYILTNMHSLEVKKKLLKKHYQNMKLRAQREDRELMHNIHSILLEQDV